MKKQSLIKASLILGLAGIFTRFLGIFFRWPLIMLIGDEGMGYYQMTYPLYMFFVAIASGIPVAVSKIVSESNAIGDIDKSFSAMRESFILLICLGTGMTLFLFFGADSIMKILKWDSKVYFSLIGVALAPLFIAIMASFRGFFQGLQNMTPSAVSQILEQIGRVIAGVGLAVILLPKGIEYAAGGAAFGAVAGGALGAIFLAIKYFKLKWSLKIKRVRRDERLFWYIIKVALPISVGAAVGTIASLIDSILVPQKLLESGLDAKQAGILFAQLTGKANVLVNIPLTLSMALSTSLIPIIAENFLLENREEVDRKVDTAIKLSNVIGIPCFLGLYFLAEPIMMMIFPQKYEGYEILKYLSFSIPFIILSQTTTAILQGTGKLIVPIINLLIGCFIKVLITVNIIPIPEINIYGAVIASIFSYMVIALLNMSYMRFKLGITVSLWDAIVKPTAAALIMISGVLFTYQSIFDIMHSNGIACLISIILGIIIYVLLIIFLGVLRYDYIKNKIVKRIR